VQIAILLKWIFKKQDRGRGLDSSGSGYGQVTGSCEHGNTAWGSIQCGRRRVSHVKELLASQEL
jgi:hypothetical protein